MVEAKVMKRKLKLGIFGLTGCAGDQLTILNCEDKIIRIFNEFDIKNFLMATSNNTEESVDIALVEGSVSCKKDEEAVMRIRAQSEKIIAIGICSSLGGIQAMISNFKDWEGAYEKVYDGVKIDSNAALQSQPIDAFVKVDYYLPGCPISEKQLLHLLTRLLRGYQPEYGKHPVCVECKYRENDCLLNKNIICLGPITSSGCEAICPSLNLPCVGCFGVYEEANTWSEFNLLLDKDFDRGVVINKMKNFSGTKLNNFIEKLKEQRA